MSLRKNLNLLLKSMEMGFEVNLISGHTLVVPDGGEEPGFLVTEIKDGIERKTIMMIGSNDVWNYLIFHAKEMSEKETTILSANITLTEMENGIGKTKLIRK